LKIRITDLLDNYYDSSVKLDAPEKIFDREDSPETQKDIQPKPEVNWGKRNLTLVASLILIVCCSLMAYLGFQRITAPGGALSEGEISETEESDSEPPVSSEEVILEETQRPDPIECMVDWYKYTQCGSSFSFTTQVSGIPEDYIQAGYTVTAVDLVDVMNRVEDPERIDYVTSLACDPSEDRSDALEISGEAELPEDLSNLVLCLKFTPEDETAPLIYASLSIGLTDRTSFMTGYSLGLIEVPSEDGSADSFITQVILSEDSAQFELFVPRKDIEDDAETDAFSDVGEHLTALLDRGCLTANVSDGTTMTITRISGCGLTRYEGGYSCQDGMFSLQPSDDGEILGEYIGGTVSFTIGIHPVTTASGRINYTVDPYPVLCFDSISWDDDLARDEDWSGNMIFDAALDQDGDGLLSAQLELPFYLDDETGTLVKFELDLSSGNVIWYYDVPTLAEALDTDPSSEETMKLDANWLTSVITTYLEDAWLVFTEGDEVLVGSGEVLNYSGTTLTGKTSLIWLAEDYNLPLLDLTPAYLRIGDTTYELQ
jgi:hypothetical protein